MQKAKIEIDVSRQNFMETAFLRGSQDAVIFCWCSLAFLQGWKNKSGGWVQRKAKPKSKQVSRYFEVKTNVPRGGREDGLFLRFSCFVPATSGGSQVDAKSEKWSDGKNFGNRGVPVAA